MANTPESSKGQEIEIIKDPIEFMNGFYKSSYYEKAYQKFFEGKKLSPDITEEEKREVFLSQEQAKLALVDYGQYGNHLEYDSSLYPPLVQLAMQTYIAITKDLEKLAHSQEEKVSWDLMKSQYHSTVAEQLKLAGIVPSEKLGRAFARLVLIEKGLEDFSAARRSDAERLRWAYGG